MALKALDLLRQIGWGVISFIFSLIDSLFEIIREMNAFDIIDSLAENSIFRNFHTSVIAIAITLFGLFVVWIFVKKIMDPEEGLSSSQIFKEIMKCGAMIMLSTFLFTQISSFSITLSGFTADIFKSNDTELSDTMLGLYVDYTDSYKVSDKPDLSRSRIDNAIKDNSFTSGEKYNEKFVTNNRFILPDKKDYVYKINWIMAIVIGGFFLYSLFFSGMMLARRQIEFLFLFLISPIVFATSVGNKQRRSAVIEQLVSLTLQAAVVMLIINMTALVMQAVNSTTFFDNAFQNIVIKSLMFIGCGSFLLTGSQVVNRFIGGNVSANSGREQLMSLMGFGQTMGTIASASSSAVTGAGMLGLGSAIKSPGAVSGAVNHSLSNVGGFLNSFGGKMSNVGKGSSLSDIGNYISNYGNVMKNKANARISANASNNISKGRLKIDNFGSKMLDHGKENLSSVIGSFVPNRNLYRRRNRYVE